MGIRYQKCFGGVRVIDQPCPINVRRLDMGIMPMVLRMQSNGIGIDKGHLQKLGKFLGEECERLTDQVADMTGFRINLASGDQIEDLLFGPSKLQLEPPSHIKKTGSGKRYTVDDETLSSIKSMHACIEVIQQFTECFKIKTSYADTLPIIAREGRVYTNLRITRQVGGRISSSDPNLMAQPTRSSIGKKIRYGFIPRKGWKMWTIDQSQIEMRIAAALSGCVSMIDTFLRDGDIHIETAARIFFKEHFYNIIRGGDGMPWVAPCAEKGCINGKVEGKFLSGKCNTCGKVIKGKKAILAAAAYIHGMDEMKHRYPAKRIGFGVLFGITGQGLQDQIFVADDPSWSDADRLQFRAEWPVERCDETIGSWYREYEEISDDIKRIHAQCRRFGYTWDAGGRIRWVPEVRSPHKRIVEAGLRQAYSLRISGTAQMTMKLAMAENWVRLIEGKYKGHIEPLLQIHDELLGEGDPHAVGDFLYDAGRIFDGVMDLDVPLKHGSDFGDSWGDLDK